MRQTLPAHPSSVRRARHLLRAELKGTAHENLSEEAELVVSELVTNAILHTGEVIELNCCLEPRCLRVEVADRGTHMPVVASYDELASTGRGLLLVAELTDEWGVETHADGKTMWFQIWLGHPDNGSAGSAGSEETGEPVFSTDGRSTPVRDDVVEVLLLDLPLLTHGAWHQQAKAILRDLLLLGIGTDPTGEIETHAAAMDAMSILEGQVGTPEASHDPDELLASAVEPHPTVSRLCLVVPRDSVPHFATLDRQMRMARTHIEAGRLLAPPLQREFAALREWICEQVRVQADGEPARPWPNPSFPSTGHLVTAARQVEAAVNDSTRTLVGADGAGVIVAASGAAAELLAYDTAGALVGRRLLDIIPRRFHQAHLAGFTLHQFSGRSPLLDRVIQVPALRRDGSEIEVSMRITTQASPSGGEIFVADLQST